MLAPLPHQSDAIQFIREREASARISGGSESSWALFDQMGLGKTLSLMYTIRSDLGTFDDRTGNAPCTLIVAPACVRNQYKERIARYGIGATTTFISYTSLAISNSSRAKRAIEKKWFRVVLDEAHLIHNVHSRRFMACARLQSRIRGVLTGTPLLRKVSDLATIAAWLCITRDQLKGATLQRTVADVQDRLPTHLKYTPLSLHEHVYERRHHVSAHETAVRQSDYTMYGSFRVGERIASLHHKLVLDREDATARTDIRDGSTREMFTHESKLDVVVGIATDSKYHPSRNIIIFTNFMKEHAILLKILPNHTSRTIHSVCGAVAPASRESIFRNAASSVDRDVRALICIERLCPRSAYAPGLAQRILASRGPGGCIMVMQQATGSVGINLQMFATVVFSNPAWCPMTDYQAMCRTHRMGQRSAVDVHWVYTNLSTEDYIDASVYKRRRVKIELVKRHVRGDCALARVERHIWTKHGRQTTVSP